VQEIEVLFSTKFDTSDLKPSPTSSTLRNCNLPPVRFHGIGNELPPVLFLVVEFDFRRVKCTSGS